jgi:hypothetical protein
MIITVELKQDGTRVGTKLSVMAPIGAAAYSVTVKAGTARILFGMMKINETGIDAYNRISNAYEVPGGWLPVAARPEEQITAAIGSADFTFYDFVKTGDSWVAASAELASFLQGLATFRSGPAQAPQAMQLKTGEMLKTPTKVSRSS